MKVILVALLINLHVGLDIMYIENADKCERYHNINLRERERFIH